MKPLNESSIIVCGIIRDAGKTLKKNIAVIDRLCDTARDYRVVIFENNSIDGTKSILEVWQYRRGEKVYVNMTDLERFQGEQLTTGVNPFYSAKRISKMVNLRNQYMDYISSLDFVADYLVVVDLDVANIDFNGVLSSFETSIEWDAITAYGYSLSPRLRERYHDTYALVSFGDKSPQTELKILENADAFSRKRLGTHPVRVSSAFGGMAIYRIEAVRNLRYKLVKNADNRVEVFCEHCSIYNQMVQKGFDRFYINPLMTVKYQRLTFPLIAKYIKRLFHKQQNR